MRTFANRKMLNAAFSLFTLLVFFILALACAKISTIRCSSVIHTQPKEEMDKNYLLTNNDQKIYGNDITYKTSLIGKKEITIDNQKFKISEIKGYFKSPTFYMRAGSDYAQRIIHGKVNVYLNQSYRTVNVAGSSSTSMNMCDYYYQLGKSGDLIPLKDQKDIKRAVSGCSTAEAMADINSSRMRKALKADPWYINKIFELYNNDCTNLSK